MNLDEQEFTLKGSELRAIADAWFSEVMTAIDEDRPYRFWPTVFEVLDLRLCTLACGVTCGYALWVPPERACTLVCTLPDLRLCTH